ncbi:MAG: hypothetical protein EF813_07275 [Methanosarcinales archaeon]|nr:MAG: hypothetical protein EF813_07275 [Methanosarcinales archaeon]
MQNRRIMVALIAATMIMICMAQVSLAKYIPESYTRSTNYYDVTGDPLLVATLVGDNEFRRGEDAVLEITLQNYGAIFTIKGDEYIDPDDSDHSNEEKLAAIEFGVELKKSAADRSRAVLLADGAPIDVAAEVREIETIEAGKTGTMRFPIRIDDDAPAGIYQLRLEVCYDHIDNVQVEGTPNNPDVNYWNVTETWNQSIPVVVEKESDFKVVCVSSTLIVGETGFLNITYQNTGEVVATDAIARISDMLPFTAARNQERIGLIAPGESVTASFAVGTDRSAVPKVYDVSTGIRFKDEDDEIKISDSMQIGAVVAPGVPFSEKLGAAKWWIIAAVLAVIVAQGWRAWKR